MLERHIHELAARGDEGRWVRGRSACEELEVLVLSSFQSRLRLLQLGNQQISFGGGKPLKFPLDVLCRLGSVCIAGRRAGQRACNQ
jgi:hypothetical protein